MGAYEGLALHLRMHLLAQDDTDHVKCMAESSTIKIDCVGLEDLPFHAFESIARGATNIRSFPLFQKRNRTAERRQRRRECLQTAALSDSSTERNSTNSCVTNSENRRCTSSDSEREHPKACARILTHEAVS